MNLKGKITHYLTLSVEKEIINNEQKNDIIKLVSQESNNYGFLKILSIIGSVSIGLGLFLIVASNWDGFPKILQLLISFFIPIIFLSIGYYFKYIQEKLSILGTSFIFLGGLSIGATIALIGQIYNIDGTVGFLLLLWLILLIPLIIIFKLKTLSMLSTFVFYSGLFYYVIDYGDYRNKEWIISISMFFIPLLISIGTHIINKITDKKYYYLLYPFFIISIKLLLVYLFFCTIEDKFYLINSIFFHNILFILVSVFLVSWANKNHEAFLKNSILFWIGIYLLTQYFTLFKGYLGGGMFFILGGLFLILIIYTFLKINSFLEKDNLNHSLLQKRKSVVSKESENLFMVKLSKINIEHIEYIKIFPNKLNNFIVKEENLLKLINLITEQKDKKVFEAGELTSIYKYIIKKYKTKLSEIEHNKIKNSIKDFIDEGGKIESVEK